MVVIHCAYTESINPPDAKPALTRSQVWKGLQRKIRKAEDFVPVIQSTYVVEDKGNEVIRIAHFKGQGGKLGQDVKEVCISDYPCKVDFIQPSGAIIRNIISDGPSLSENDLNMTYTFEWRHPEVEEGSEEHKRLEQESREGAKMAVHSSIMAMRKMAAARELD